MTVGIPPIKVLRLNFQDPHLGGWQVSLLAPNGEQLADHQVSFDAVGHDGVLPWVSVLTGDVTEAGDHIDTVRRWIGDWLLGPIGPRLLVEAPVTVHVQIPSHAEFLLECPLELASARDPYRDTEYAPLAENQVGFVFEHVGVEKDVEKTPVVGKLRILAVFSEPTGCGGSILHREWRGLPTNIDSIAKLHRRAIEVRTLTYGATPEDLEAVLSEAHGWDVVYLCGRDLRKGLVLRQPDGSAKTLSTKKVLDDLVLTKSRLKVLVFSERHPVDHITILAQPKVSLTAPVTTALARQAVKRLDCSVVSFRWPPCEEFSTEFALSLFSLLTLQRQSLPGAVPLAVKKAVKKAADQTTRRVSWCCMPSPVIHGAAALKHAIEPPDDSTPLNFDPTRIRFVGFPSRPTAAAVPVDFMRQMIAALTGDKPHEAILLLGDRTDTYHCALNLAYDFEGLFVKGIWYEGPAAEVDVHRAFESFVRALDDRLDCLHMSDHLGDIEILKNFLLSFKGILSGEPVLVVMSNVDLLLYPNGDWRDQRFGPLIQALTNHGGHSRLIITSNQTPNGLEETVRLCQTPTNAIGAMESEK